MFFYKKIKKLKKQVDEMENKINNMFLWQANFHRDIPEYFPAALSSSEKNMLITYLKQSENYLEFGSGGSTFLALIHGSCKIFSTESDPTWINYLRSWKIIETNEKNNRLHFEYINLGEIGDWGTPKNLNQDFTCYSNNAFKNENNLNADCIFIDGRFRVACGLNSVLKSKNNPYIIIHDYPDRSQYHILEEFLTVIEHTDSLYIFKIKENIDTEAAEKLYNQYKNIHS